MQGPHFDALWLWGSAVVVALSFAWLVRTMLRGDLFRGTLLEQRVTSHVQRIAGELRFLRSPLSAPSIVAVECGTFVASVLAAAEWGPWWFVGLLGSGVPSLLLLCKRRARVRKLETQIEGFLGALGRSLQAIPALGEALETSAASCRAPMSEEIELVLKEIRLGRPIDRALAAWSDRVQSRTLTLALCALWVGRDTGGSLPDVLFKASASLRELERLEGVLRAKTAEGRAQTWVISVLPVPLYFLVVLVDEKYFVPLQTTPIGHVVVILAILLWMVAVFLARKIMAVQV